MKKIALLFALVFVFTNYADASISNWVQTNLLPPDDEQKIYVLRANYTVSGSRSIALDEGLNLSFGLNHYRLDISAGSVFTNYGNIFGLSNNQIRLAGATFDNYGAVEYSRIVAIANSVIINRTGGVIQNPVEINAGVTLTHRVFENAQLGSFNITKAGAGTGKFSVVIEDATDDIDLGRLNPSTDFLSIANSNILIPVSALVLSIESLDIDAATTVFVLDFEYPNILEDGIVLFRFTKNDVVSFDLEAECMTNLNLACRFEYVSISKELKLVFEELPGPGGGDENGEPGGGEGPGGGDGNEGGDGDTGQEPGSGGENGGGDEEGGDNPIEIPGVEFNKYSGDDTKFFVSIDDYAHDVNLGDITAVLEIGSLFVRNARLIVHESMSGAQALRLDSLELINATLILNVTDPESYSDGDFITLFRSSSINIPGSVTLETNLSEFFKTTLEIFGEDYGIRIEKNSDFVIGETPGPGFGSGRSAAGNYIVRVQDENPYGSAIKKLESAPLDSYEKVLDELFGTFQALAMNLATSVQRNVQNIDMGFARGPGEKGLYAKALYVSAPRGYAAGISVGSGGVFDIYSAMSRLDYFDGEANGAIVGGRIAPRVEINDWTFRVEAGYQMAWFDEKRSVFGLDSENKLEVASAMAGASVEYRIGIGKNFSLSPIARYNFQESKVTSHKDELFLDKNNRIKGFSYSDGGAKIEYKVRTVNTSHYFGVLGTAGYDFRQEDIVATAGVYSIISIDQDFVWIEAGLTGTRFDEFNSYAAYAKLRLKF
ncbi:MAG: autotransporter outer membrane beta-barrel domain-containing protein [Alphaproteobacteria bacterium]|nr:autotransporter outer membrane beta-barrel domain-containing protein [Alphaproteobacteria bacterium]